MSQVTLPNPRRPSPNKTSTTSAATPPSLVGNTGEQKFILPLSREWHRALMLQHWAVLGVDTSTDVPVPSPPEPSTGKNHVKRTRQEALGKEVYFKKALVFCPHPWLLELVRVKSYLHRTGDGGAGGRAGFLLEVPHLIYCAFLRRWQSSS